LFIELPAGKMDFGNPSLLGFGSSPFPFCPIFCPNLSINCHLHGFFKPQSYREQTEERHSLEDIRNNSVLITCLLD